MSLAVQETPSPPSPSSSSSPPPKKPKRCRYWTDLIPRRRKIVVAVRTTAPHPHSLESSHGLSWTRVGLLGKGAFGSVYFAKSNQDQNSHLPLQMAVKSALTDDSSSLQYEKQILTELQDSPHVVHCYGDEITQMGDGNQVYNLLLEFCGGLSLKRTIRISPGGRLSDSDIKCYARDVLEGLAYVHSRGYIHCDIKPDNILLVPGGEGKKGRKFVAKLADFGLAKVADGLADSELRGTYMFMSPELVESKVVDFPADIWAFGCTLVEMMTGKSAWDYSDVEDLLYVIGESDELPNLPSSICESEDATDFFGRCLCRNASFRWSAEMLLDHPFLSI
ncbi:mitogen-activated protein kinase kinase kinase 17-like [Mercurialis annua]|uniref:mitogen-activated protein kinase kinase kinase 17-like n=1 Tax=Mercurialis annua TaxID=3986 RepID=UPI002160B2DD|nr:mitogen-activated protein kinase kinase kinase 17-like [Mercurialis annua]